MCSISWKLTIGCCAYQGKDSSNGKRGERWYHFVIRYNVYVLKDPKNGDISSPEVWRPICLLK